jgi:hypothetical protein
LNVNEHTTTDERLHARIAGGKQAFSRQADRAITRTSPHEIPPVSCSIASPTVPSSDRPAAFMSPRIALTIVVLSLPVGSLGCPSALTDASRPSLPGFGAPEQWEPQVESTPQQAGAADDEMDF